MAWDVQGGHWRKLLYCISSAALEIEVGEMEKSLSRFQIDKALLGLQVDPVVLNGKLG